MNSVLKSCDPGNTDNAAKTKQLRGVCEKALWSSVRAPPSTGYHIEETFLVIIVPGGESLYSTN